MGIIDTKAWKEWEKNNKDSYENACIKVARRTIELLDKDLTPLHNGYHPDIHTAHGIMCKADEETNAGGITGFMAGCVAGMVYKCHSRGDEFRISFNGEHEADGVINPALVTIEVKGGTE